MLKIDDEYSHALVGTPDHKNLWLLNREPQISSDVEGDYLSEAVRQGFDLTDWIRPYQSGNRVTEDML